MATYESKRHPGIFITSDGVVDPKYKTVDIQFSDGRIQSISAATLSLWYTKVNDVEEIPNTDTSLPEDDTHTDAQKSDIVYEFDFINDYVYPYAKSCGMQIRTWESKHRLFAITYKGKTTMEIYIGKKSFKLRVRSGLLKAGESYEKHKYNFDATLDLPYNEQGYSTLESLMTRSIKYNIDKPKQQRKSRKEKK